jgi:hypothetical protein
MNLPEIPDYVWMTACIVGFLFGAVWFFCSSCEQDHNDPHNHPRV